MWLLTLLPFLLFSAVSMHTDSRIIDGRLAQKGEFPYQVSLRHNNEHVCGGSIISLKNTITAAHCSHNRWGEVLPPHILSLVAGQLTLTVTASTIHRSVQRVIPHPQFDSETLANDAAIIVTEEWPFDKLIGQVPLNAGLTPTNFPCVVSGWGVLKYEDNILSQELRATEVFMVDLTECEKRYNSSLYPGMTCAVNDNRATDACQGDSGGPLVCGGRLTGVVSAGKGCANNSFPGIYSDVSYYLSWILETIRDKSVKPVLIHTAMIVMEIVDVTLTTTNLTDATSAVVTTEVANRTDATTYLTDVTDATSAVVTTEVANVTDGTTTLATANSTDATSAVVTTKTTSDADTITSTTVNKQNIGSNSCIQSVHILLLILTVLFNRSV